MTTRRAQEHEQVKDDAMARRSALDEATSVEHAFWWTPDMLLGE